MVFDLVSKITGRKTTQTFNVSSKMYQMNTTELNITNPFEFDGDFKIQIIPDTQFEKEETKNNKKGKNKKEKNKPVEDDDLSTGGRNLKS
jgi:hypothetical protein